MRVSYQYRLKPNKEQIAKIEKWLELLRCQYNYLLGQRFNWWETHRTAVNSCPLICHLPELSDRPTYFSQKQSLTQLKKDRPWYKEIQSQVLQDCVKRVDLSFQRWLRGDKKGKKSGKPRFKGKGRYRTILFPQVKADCVQDNHINLPKFGKIRFIKHRPIPEGFKVKTAQITRKADGYYLTLSLEDKNVPESTIDIVPTSENTLGIDMGLKDFLVTSEGEKVEIPQFYRKGRERLKKLQQKVSRRQKGSNRYLKAVKQLGKHHQKVARQRKDFHFNTIKLILSKGDVIAHEKLNIKGLARTRLSKSIYDAGWGTFLSRLAVKAENAGQLTIEVNPKNTSQNCSGCGEKVPKKLSERTHDCPHCGLTMCRDKNAAINIKNMAINIRNLAVGIPVSSKAQSRTEAKAGAAEKPHSYRIAIECG
ncbi:RNA-guided endonuclease InsQ/TnpB family protein [Dactylococcopsis salina]